MYRNIRGTTARIAVAALAIVMTLSLAACATPASENSTTGGVAVSPPELVSPQPARDGVTSSEGYGYDTSKGGTGTTTSSTDKLVVVNKTVRIETDDVDASIAKIRELVARDGADISNMQVSTANGEPVYPKYSDGTESSYGTDPSAQLQGYVTVRVPKDKYAAFIADVMKLGTVLYQSETADDVTQQHVDMVARIENLKAEEARLRQLFDKATKVDDMLAIEQELARVQGEIESMQAQITYLENQAALATVNIELKEPTPVVSPAGIDWGTKTAFTESVRAFVNTLNSLIIILGPVLALLLFVGLPVWLVVWFVRKRLRKRAAAKLPPPPVAESNS